MKLSCTLCVWSVLAALYGCSRSGPEASQGCGSVENLGAPTCVAHPSDSGQPLVAGAQVRLVAASDLPDAIDYDVSSDAPAVVEVVDARITSECGQPTARITAKQPGTTRVRFTPAEGDPVIVEVRVELAQRIAVTPFLDDRASSVPTRDGQHPPVLVDELVQVAGGSMLWLVRYYGAGEQELRGRGLASITPPSFASAALAASDERELFELRTQTEGEGEIKLTAVSTELQLPLRSVPAAAVTSLQLYVEADVADAGAGTRSFGHGARVRRLRKARVRHRDLVRRGRPSAGVGGLDSLRSEAWRPVGADRHDRQHERLRQHRHRCNSGDHARLRD